MLCVSGICAPSARLQPFQAELPERCTCSRGKTALLKAEGMQAGRSVANLKAMEAQKGLAKRCSAAHLAAVVVKSRAQATRAARASGRSIAAPLGLNMERTS